MYPESLLIHTATLTHTLEEVQSATTGELVPTTTTTVVKCRFFPGQTVLKAGILVILSARVVLPADTLVSLGDTVIITTKSFSKTYTISADPKPTFEPVQDVVSHWTCEIAAAGATGGA